MLIGMFHTKHTDYLFNDSDKKAVVRDTGESILKDAKWR